MLVSRGCSFSDLRFTRAKRRAIGLEDATFFTYSREAILDILEFNDINSDDEVLLPSYLCSTVIEAILTVTKKIKFYHLDRQLICKQSEILELLSEKTRLIVFVDYFGVETKLTKPLQLQLERRNIIVVKDAAHAFLSVASRNFQENYNYDYLITSIYKNLPFQAGAIALGKFGRRPDFISLYVVLKRFGVLATKNFICILGLQRFLGRGKGDMTISDASHVERTRGLNIVKLYKGILTKIDLEKVVSERKALTKEFNKFFFGRRSIRPVFSREQIDLNVLQDYPLYFQCQDERNKMLNTLASHSIDAYTWPTFHRINCGDKFWSKVLIVPIDRKVLKVLWDV